MSLSLAIVNRCTVAMSTCKVVANIINTYSSHGHTTSNHTTYNAVTGTVVASPCGWMLDWISVAGMLRACHVM